MSEKENIAWRILEKYPKAVIGIVLLVIDGVIVGEAQGSKECRRVAEEIGYSKGVFRSGSIRLGTVDGCECTGRIDRFSGRVDMSSVKFVKWTEAVKILESVESD